jgi:threonine synthase
MEQPRATHVGGAARLDCSLCGRSSESNVLATVSRCCGMPLFARYDLEAIRDRLAPAAMAGRRSDLWRYADVLPVAPARSLSLGEGFTPLLDVPRLAGRTGVRRLHIKDEGRNPTGSFKDRGAAVALSRARELGVTEIAVPSSGNAAAAAAAYGAALGMGVHAFVPASAAPSVRAQILAYGAELVRVDGTFAECGEAAATAARKHGWFLYATLREPYRVEGKKTMAYEIVEQLGFRVPDALLYPTGGTTGFVAMWKAFDEMERLGWIGRERPRMIAVQAHGCAPLVRAWERGADRTEPWGRVSTYAAGLSAPTVFGDYLTLRAIRESGGGAVAVTDADMARWVDIVARDTGLFISPEGGAVAGAVVMLRDRGDLAEGDEVVLFATATGLKYVARTPQPASAAPVRH